jgi:hypothetical protein
MALLITKQEINWTKEVLTRWTRIWAVHDNTYNASYGSYESFELSFTNVCLYCFESFFKARSGVYTLKNFEKDNNQYFMVKKWYGRTKQKLILCRIRNLWGVLEHLCIVDLSNSQSTINSACHLFLISFDSSCQKDFKINMQR